MKKVFLFFILIAAATTAFPQANITFRVDMGHYADFKAADGVYIAGAAPFSWTAGKFTQMTDVNGDSIYEVTMPNVTQASFDYKFVNGNSWNGKDEKMTDAACKGSGTNRKAMIGATTTDTVLSFMFNSCDTAGSYYAPIVFVNATFTVDVKYQAKIYGVEFNKIYLTGEMNGWNTDTATLESNNWMFTKKSEYIYEGTFNLEGNKSYTYKIVFNNGGALAQYEQSGNRPLTLGKKDTILQSVCFNSDTYPCPIPPDPSDMTFRVQLADSLTAGDSVFVIGTFSDPEVAVMMTDSNNDHVYEVTIPNVASGTILYRYMYGQGTALTVEFVGDTVATACGFVNDLKNGLNRKYVRLDSSDVTLSIQPFDSCISYAGIADHALAAASLHVYPNPFSDFTTVELGNMNNSVSAISIVDMIGQTVLQTSTADAVFRIYRNQLHSGFYFLVITNENKRYVNKLIVE